MGFFKKEISTTRGLIVLFGAVVFLFGAAFTYYFQMVPDYEMDSPFVLVPVKADATKDWKTYTDKTLGFTMKYPANYAINTGDGDKGAPFVNIDVAKISSLNNPMGDDAAGANARKTALLDGQLPSNNPIGQPIQSSEKVVKVSGSYNALDQMILQELSCDSVMLVRETVFYVNDYQVDIRSSIGGDPLTIIPAKYLTTDTNCTGNTTTKIWKDNAGFYSDIASNKLSNSLQSWYNNYPLIIQSVKFTTATSAAATTTTPAATSTSQTYTNDKYGFNLTLPADWDKYKVKSTVVDGELNTYYFTLPTTDSTYAQATTTADAGYAAPFVIGVMNKSDWTGSEDQLRDFGDKIGENDKYVFTVSYWQAKPTDLSDSIATEAHAIVASFILAQ